MSVLIALAGIAKFALIFGPVVYLAARLANRKPKPYVVVARHYLSNGETVTTYSKETL